MRQVVRGFSVLIVAGVISGCSKKDETSKAAPPATTALATIAITAAPTTAQADKVVATKAFVMQAGGANVLQITAPADVKLAAADGSLHFTTPKYEVEFWLVGGAQTVDDGIARVGTQIVSEFKDFKADRTTDLTVTGSPAKRLVGTGHEADDNDPGSADVVVFKVGDHVFVACTHGESLDPVAQQGMLTLLGTAQLPQ